MLVFGYLRLLDVIVLDRVIVQPIERLCRAGRMKAVEHVHHLAGLEADDVHNAVAELLAVFVADNPLFHRVVDNGRKHVVGAGHFVDGVDVGFILNVVLESEFLHQPVVNHVEVVEQQMRLRILQ